MSKTFFELREELKESTGRSVSEGPFKGIGKMMMKRKLNKKYDDAEKAYHYHIRQANDAKAQSKLDKYHSGEKKKADKMRNRLNKAHQRLSRGQAPNYNFN